MSQICTRVLTDTITVISGKSQVAYVISVARTNDQRHCYNTIFIQLISGGLTTQSWTRVGSGRVGSDPTGPGLLCVALLALGRSRTSRDLGFNVVNLLFSPPVCLSIRLSVCVVVLYVCVCVCVRMSGGVERTVSCVKYPRTASIPRNSVSASPLAR